MSRQYDGQATRGEDLSTDEGRSRGGKQEKPLRSRDAKAIYDRPPSFTDLLPFSEYVGKTRSFLFEDGVSVGALFELTPVGAEARTPAFMSALRDALETAITDAIPELDEPPWVLQVYVQDEPSLNYLADALERYGEPAAQATPFARHFRALFAEHLNRISRPGGLFVDEAVTGSRWRGQVRRVRATLYRRLEVDGRVPSALEVEAALDDVSTRWVAALGAAGIRARRCEGVDFYRWLLRWFNPRPALTGGDPEKLLELAPYPGDERLPFGYDFAELLTLSMPRSVLKDATWWFDGLPHKFITVQTLRRVPEIGHMTAERVSGDHVFTLFDRLPEHTVMVLNVIVKPQDTVRAGVMGVARAAVGASADATLTREEGTAVEREMASGKKLYPIDFGFYVRGGDLRELHDNVNRVNALLLANALQPIVEESDELAVDSYIRNLPMTKDSIPGTGLLPKLFVESSDVALGLQDLVSGAAPPSLDNLEKVTAPGVAITRQVIEAIREMPATEQGLIIGRLVAEVSQARVLEKALYARRLLLSGRQVPEVYATEVAREHADIAIAELDREIESLLFETRVRREVVSETVVILLRRAAARRQAALNVPQTSPLDPKPLKGSRVE